MYSPRGPILCVDDEPSLLGLMRDALQHDYRLIFARSGADAVEAAQRHKPSLVLLDVQMPGMDGIATAQALRQLQPADQQPQIIFVTARDAEIDEAAGFAAGAVDYITKPFSTHILKARVSSHLSRIHVKALEASHRSALYMLGEAGHYRDDDTGHHIWRMAAFASMLARQAGWNARKVALLELAAPMHDTGKIGTPDAILKKPGPLTPEEWVLMRQHTTIGRDILVKGHGEVFALAAEIALRHHERWDGSGYPDGLAGEAIPESARIVAVADVFDALTSKRPYKEPWPIDRAVETLLASRDTHLEGRLVTAFMDILPGILEEKQRWDAREVEAQAPH